ncbi:GTP 3',8-cyclase MoaA [Pleomorphochaeta sp. DL1XJH-081]|uniref:GTP 3',8-cyclase MoaA n=1 Tax=Pleomorphochaeta sp. DL1XJH-081 TaxID=3409690 RepID=UPI003BB49028
MRDKFERDISYLRLSVTDKCNLRCRYCMPADGVENKEHKEMLTQEEMLAAVKICAGLGIHKVRITGGEPLVKRNILSICRGIAETDGIDYVALTTNGLLLPKYAKDLKEAGVKQLNISLDTLDPAKYGIITRIGKLEDALKGLECALEVGFEKVKINAVLIGGFNDDEIPALAQLSVLYPVDVRFIELMPMCEDGFFSSASFLSSKAIMEALRQLSPEPSDGGVAKLYRITGGQGQVGIISPLSNHFCSSCNRIRITADGKVKPCLHSKVEYNIKGLTAEEMEKTIRDSIWGKPEKHNPLSFKERSESSRNMNEIGG